MSNPARREVPAGGLYVLLEPTGGISWATRARLNGKAVKVTLERFGGGPDGLNTHLDLREKLRSGVDVPQECIQAKAESDDAKADTLRKVGQAYIEAEARKPNVAKSLKRTAQNLELSLGGKPSRPSRAPITTAFLERIEAKTGLRTAQQAMCRWYAKRNDAYAFPFLQGFWNTAQNKRSRQFSDQALRIFGTPQVGSIAPKAT